MKIGKLEVYGVIYKITNKVNGKVYIGQTTRGFRKRYERMGTGIERVYKYHKSKMDKGQWYNAHLFNSIDKYGFTNFEVVEVFDIAFTLDELNIKEEMYIKLYSSNEKNYGYNYSPGGRFSYNVSRNQRKNK